MQKMTHIKCSSFFFCSRIVRFWVKERKNVIHVEREERNSKKRRKKEQKQMVEYAIFGT